MKVETLSRIILVLNAVLLVGLSAAPAAAQAVTIVGTQHLRGLDTPPTREQYEHAINALSAFAPTQVCIERMSGLRLQNMIQDPMRNAVALSPQTHKRPLGTLVIPLGFEMQTRLAISAADAREDARDLAERWDEIGIDERVRLVGLLIAGFEFLLDEKAKKAAARSFLEPAVEPLNLMLSLDDEAYALAVPIARRSGLHALCTADAQENEAAGMEVAFAHGGQQLLGKPEIKARFNQYAERMNEVWRPGSGPEALTQMLAYMNSDEFAAFDRENQWELMRSIDNEAGVFHRRLMYWHARTAQISSELYRALAQGPEERVLLIIGAAHRPFNEAEMRSQPWVTVEPASVFLGEPIGAVKE